MMRRKLLPLVVIVLALSAAYFSLNLLAKHLRGSSGMAWFETTCESGNEGGGGANCDAVLATPWSYIPPKHPGDPPDKYTLYGFNLQFPAAFLGMVYYSALAVWFVGIGRPSRSRRWIFFFPAIVVVFGLVSSLFFSYLMFFSDIEEWCPWCMVTHVQNLLIAICLVFMWPSRVSAETAAANPPDPQLSNASPGNPASVARTTTTRPGHPSGRLILVTGIAIALAAYAQLQLLGRAKLAENAASLQSQLARLTAEVRYIQQDGDKLVKQWRKGERHDIPIRADDPLRRPADSARRPLPLVVFSDLECPACRSFDRFLEEKVQPLFAGNLALIFKHYPLDSDCNPHLTKKAHPHACYAMRLAEGARLLGGSDAFWRVHDYLQDNLHRLRHEEVIPEDIARLIGVKPEALREAMNAEEIAARVKEDSDRGKELGIRGTPTPFVNGRQVGYLYMKEINFWDKLADLYWQNIKEPRPETTKLYQETDNTGIPATAAVTPDTPDRPGGP